MLTDAERVLIELKSVLMERPSWGADQLLVRIARLEVEHRISPDEYEMFVRRYAHHFVDSFMGLMPRASEEDVPLTGDGATSLAMSRSPHLRSSSNHSEASCPQHQQHPVLSP